MAKRPFFMPRGVSKRKRPLRSKPVQVEQAEQIAFVSWLDLYYPFVQFCASAGGMRTSKRTAVNMVRMGYRKGFPDMFFYEPLHGFHGLAIEMKRPKGGKVSEEQKGWIDGLRARGYKAEIARGFDEAKAIILDYFKQQSI